jgi:hypothetical protein
MKKRALVEVSLMGASPASSLTSCHRWIAISPVLLILDTLLRLQLPTLCELPFLR